MPEIERSYGSLPESSKKVLRDFVKGGGTLIQIGDYGSNDVNFLNTVFRWNLRGTGSANSSSLRLNNSNASGTAWQGGPASLRSISVTSSIGRGSVSGFKAIYGSDSKASVAEISYGTGKVIYIGEDYYSFGYATNWGEGTHRKGSYTDSYQWAKQILPRALQASGTGSTPTPPPSDDGDAEFKINGSPKVGQTVTAIKSKDDPDGNGTFAYSWEASADKGSTWKTVGTGQNFRITTSQSGQQLRLRVQYQDGDGFKENIATAPVSIPTLDFPPSIIEGTNRSEEINGTGKFEWIYAYNGFDTVNANGGNDRLYGGYGNDVLSGGDGSDELYGEMDDDKLYGGNGDDRLIGGEGADYLDGGNGSDTYFIDDERDTIKDTGTDAGIDTVFFRYYTDRYQMGEGIEKVIMPKASLESFSIEGNNLNNTIKANSANNTITGLNGNDVIDAGDGNDVINGGKGSDTAEFSSRNNRINLNTKRWQNTGDGKDRLISIENINAGSGNDIVVGNRAANTLNGQAGNDRLYGGSRNDHLYGGSGNDFLIGGSGRDHLWGQGGRDTFRIQRGTGYDVIKDFSDGEDRIQLGSGRKGIRLKTRCDDVLVYQNRDLMAIVEDSAGDLVQRGNFLI